MNQETITIDISPAGTVNIEASGFRGAACEKATEQLEVVLGGGIAKKKSKPERHMPPLSSAQHNKLSF